MGLAVVVEIAGVSCSGKSTAIQGIKAHTFHSETIEGEDYLQGYYQNIAKSFLLKDSIAQTPVFKFVVVAQEHLKNIFRFRRFYVLCIAKVIRGDGRIKAFRSIFFKIGKYYIFKKANAVQIIMDEGPLQMLFSLFVRNKEMDDVQGADVKSLIACMPMADKVIMAPDGPQDLLVSRMLSRGHHRVMGTGEQSQTLNAIEYREVEKRTNVFIERSIHLQRMIVLEAKKRVPITCLSHGSDWEGICDGFCR